MTDKRENFPLESLRYMEHRLGEIRRRVMDTAAQIAEAECTAQTYTVEKRHVDEAMKRFEK